MRLGAFAGADVRVDGLAHDRVCELETLRGLQDRELCQHVRTACRLLLRELGQAGRLGDARAVAEYRHGSHQRGRRGGPTGEAQEHRLGDGGGADASHADRRPGIRRDALFGGLAQERLEEERVAAGGFAACLGELRGHLRAEPLPAQRGGRLRAQRPGRSTVVSGAAASRARSSEASSPGRVVASTATGRPSRRGAR